MSDNLSAWNSFSKPPPSFLKKIGGGRLAGKSDINPQWRYKAMTEQYGPCGIGWKFEIVRFWTEKGDGGEVFAFSQINLFTLTPQSKDCVRCWSAPIPGIGGSMLIAAEKGGLHNNDEAFKMATTDALGTAMKMLGVAAEVYLGNWDGAKYKETPEETAKAARAQHDATAQADVNAQMDADPDFAKMVDGAIRRLKEEAGKGIAALQNEWISIGAKDDPQAEAIRASVHKRMGLKWWKALKAQAAAVEVPA